MILHTTKKAVQYYTVQANHSGRLLTYPHYTSARLLDSDLPAAVDASTLPPLGAGLFTALLELGLSN